MTRENDPQTYSMSVCMLHCSNSSPRKACAKTRRRRTLILVSVLMFKIAKSGEGGSTSLLGHMGVFAARISFMIQS